MPDFFSMKNQDIIQARWNVFKATGTMPGFLNLPGLYIVLNPDFDASLKDIWTLEEN